MGSNMKILVIGHTYIPLINRTKWIKLAEKKDVELSIISPKMWPHNFKTYLIEFEKIFNYKLLPTNTLFHGKESWYFYLSPTMHLNKIKPDIIHVEQGTSALSYFQTLILKKIFAPKAKTIFFSWQNIYFRQKFPFSFFEKFNLSNSDYAIVGNEDAKQIIRKKGFKKPIKVLPQLGVDPKVYKKMDASDIKTELGLHSFVIGFVGRLVEGKGLITLIDAVSNITDDYQLLLVGRGELKETIIEIATKYNILDKIVFIDTVPHEEVPLYLNCMDVMVLPSLTTSKWMEQFGHVLIEAMSCEVPVIGSSSAEIPNVIGDAGLIFNEGDSDDLYKKIITLMDDNQSRGELALKGHERVLQKYTNEMIAEETYKIYTELLKL